MKNIVNAIQSHLKDAAIKAFGDSANIGDPAVDAASNPQFGDFQANLALTLAKQLKQQPRAIAEQIVKQLSDMQEDTPGAQPMHSNGNGGASISAAVLYEKPSVAGPGFINFRLKKDFLETQLNTIKSDSRAGVAKAVKPKKVIVDMSSPNIAKEMHVGHLRSTIIGESIARTYEFLGHDVSRINHVGDWGTQFGMLITELQEKFPTALTQSEALDLGDLVTFYKQAKKHFDEDEDFKLRSRNKVVALQSGDPDAVKAWKLLCAQSRKSFEEIYDILDVKNLEERGESFYNDMLADTVQKLEEKGLAVESDGAKCVFLDGYLTEEGNPLPVIVQKKDGGFNYSATDLATVRFRVDNDHADEIIYVVDAGQSLHFEMMLKVARKAGFLPDHVRTQHVPFGVVLGEDGKKLKTRSGETIRLKDLLQEAVAYSRRDLEQRLTDRSRTEATEWKDEVATKVGIAAVKYADLSLNRMTNYVFSYDKMLSLQGNTAPYMMYAYVRVKGICREGGIDMEKLEKDAKIILDHPTELELAKQLLRLDDPLDAVIHDFLPNRICEYLFELSQRFNQFYEACPVLNAEEPIRSSRLLLCDMTARAIKIGLSLLGITTVERM